MKYMVMECHLSYAVVLDEDGRFLKVANRHYEVGQTVTEVIEMQIPQTVPKKKKTNKWIYSLAAMAACLVLIVTSVFQMKQIPYASVYLTINPQVRIDVNKTDTVVGLIGVNADGETLIEGYDYKKKTLDTVMDELVDRAIDMGYLHEGGRITLSLDADEEWAAGHSKHLIDHLNEYLTNKITVTIDIEQEQSKQSQSVPAGPIVIPVDPDYYGESDDGQSDYEDASDAAVLSDDAADDDGQTDYGTSNDVDDGQTDYGTPNDVDDGQTDYGTPNDVDDGQTDYGTPNDVDDGQTDYGTSNDVDGQTDYGTSNDVDDGQTDYGTFNNVDDGASDYDFSGGEAFDDGDSAYEDPDDD